jgi:hypothetical protein
MRRAVDPAAWLALVLLLGAVLFPALFLGRVVAPETTLKNVPPWRLQWGPAPSPQARALEAATQLGPRLHVIAREGIRAAIWNPWIGGGRPGWLASAREGGAPLVVAAAWLARPGSAWTALVALQLAAAFCGTVLVLRRLGVTGWPAATGALAYALSGAAAGQWLGWQGSAMALGPLALLPALGGPQRGRSRAAAWTAILVVLLLCGPPALAFVAFALVVGLLRGGRATAAAEAAAVALACVIALAAVSPRLVLDRHGAEPDAPPAVRELPVPPIGLAALVEPTAPRSAGQAAAGAAEDSRALAFLGMPVLLLAAVGAWFAPSRLRGTLVAVAVVSLLGCLLPATTLARAGLVERPFGTLALASALLAGLGAAAVTARCPRPAAPLLALLLGAALLLRLLPPAVATLPFGEPAEARPAVALPAEVLADAARVLPLLDALPPDVGARFALADVRASSLAGEPRYRALLGSRDGRTVTVSRALDPRTARLGARWLLEPLPLRVVSGALFSGIDAGEASRRPSLLGSTVVYEVTAPDRVCRVGLPATAGRPAQIVIATAGRTAWLLPDPALAGESERWSWFALPEGWPAGLTALEIERGDVAWPDRLPVVADRSGLRLVSEEGGVRVWRWDRVLGPAFLARAVVAGDTALSPDPGIVGVPAGGAVPALDPPDPDDRAEVRRATPAGLEVETRCRGACVLVLQVKYRPGLWRVTVDGAEAVPLRADGVWTGVALGPGTHLVRTRARLPLAPWLLAALALLAIPALAAGRRTR